MRCADANCQPRIDLLPDFVHHRLQRRGRYLWQIAVAACPVSTAHGRGSFGADPDGNRAISSMGWVADKPMRRSGCRAARQSLERQREMAALVAVTWISSTMTVRVVASMFLPIPSRGKRAATPVS